MSKKLTIHLESCDSSNKLNTIKAIRELTGLGLKESKELVDRAPIDFEATGDIDTFERVLRGAGANVTVKEIKETNDTQKELEEKARKAAENARKAIEERIKKEAEKAQKAEEEARKKEAEEKAKKALEEIQKKAKESVNQIQNELKKHKNEYTAVFLPSLASKRTDAVQVLQEVMGIERWEAEIYVDKSPIQLSFTEREKANLLMSKMTALGFEIGMTIPPVYTDENDAKESEKKIREEKNKAYKAIENIQGAYDKIIPLVTLSKLVSDLVIKETLINIETAENNYRKILNMSGMAKTLQDKASKVLDDFVSIKERALELLVNAQSNMAFTTQSFSSLEEMVENVTALFGDGKNLCKNLIKSAVSQIDGFAKTAEEAINSAKDIEKRGSDLLEKYSGEAIYEGLTALSEINFALPLPHTVRGTVYRRSRFDADNVRVPFVGVLVEISGIVSPDADKTEADENPSCYTDSNGDFIIVMPERYSLKEAVRIIVSQGANRQVFTKSAAEFLYSVPEQKLLDQFIEVDNLGRELSNLKTNLSRLEVDYDEFCSYKKKLDIDMTILVRQREENSSTDLEQLDPMVLEYIESMNINLDEAKGEIEKEISALEIKIQKVEKSIEEIFKKIERQRIDIQEYESRFESQKTTLLMGLKAQKNLSFPETIDLDKVFDAFLAKTTAPEAKLEGTDLKEEYEGFVIIDEVFEGNHADAAKALPSVKLMENEGREIRLPSDTAPSRVFNYSMLQRLVEPKLTMKDPKIGKRVEVTRKTMSEPVDVKDFKESMTSNPDIYPQMSTLGMGYVLNMHQAWVPDGFALGSLLYSLILAPGEEQRLIVRENKQTYLLSDMAEGTDLVSEDYQLTQEDDTTAAYKYALNQLSTANSHYSYQASTWGVGGAGGFGGIGEGIAGMLGLSGSYSRSSGNASSSASQSNSHNEASTAAQSFQHSIKSASDKIAQSKRISVNTASSDVSESAATKIIANHNHSHAMTIQYWEVMRRYRLETCVEGVDLVLFVPLKLVRFLPEAQKQFLQFDNRLEFDKSNFEQRYNVLLKYAQTLQYALPYKYRQGLKLIQRYSALPRWELEKNTNELTVLTFSFKASLLSCDRLTATLFLKNGKGSITSTMNVSNGQPKDLNSMGDRFMKTTDLLKALSEEREKGPSVLMSCEFNLPDDIHEDDLSYIRVSYSCENTSIPLRFSDLDPEITVSGAVKGMKSDIDYVNMGLGISQAQGKAIVKMADAYWDYIKNNKGSLQDLMDYKHYRQAVPECLQAYPDKKYVELNNTSIRKIEPARITEAQLGGARVSIALPSDRLSSSMKISISTEVNTLRLAELRKIEETFMHVISETMHYSQMIWSDLSADERAMMLEKYTIDMDFASINDSLTFGDDDGIKENGKITIPLLNCVNVKKVMGFYGNCILMPFTYPSSLARKLGKTAGEIQDALYRYHTSSFRAPTTTISLPTSGMVGEAVLGETNVSEKIDITRFWNWQDSPIDKMTLNENYLKGTDYLSGKTTQDITALGLEGATAATPVTNVDLISALVKKQTPTFDDITGLDQLKEVLNAGTTSAATGRDNYLKEASAMATKALDTYAASSKPKKNGENNQPSTDQNDNNDQNGTNGTSGGQKRDGKNGGQNGSSSPNGSSGPNGNGAAGGPSASFTATLTFNTGNMNGTTTATTQNVPPKQDTPAPEDQQQEDQPNDNSQSSSRTTQE